MTGPGVPNIPVDWGRGPYSTGRLGTRGPQNTVTPAAQVHVFACKVHPKLQNDIPQESLHRVTSLTSPSSCHDLQLAQRSCASRPNTCTYARAFAQSIVPQLVQNRSLAGKNRQPPNLERSESKPSQIESVQNRSSTGSKRNGIDSIPFRFGF